MRRRRSKAPPVVRILLADDDDDIRALISSSLARSGYEVVEFWNGGDLLDWVRDGARSFGLVVSDIGMPGADGVEVCRAVLKMRPGIPVVLITAFRDAETLRRGQDAGARAVLVKPFDTRRVVTLVSELLHAA